VNPDTITSRSAGFNAGEDFRDLLMYNSDARAATFEPLDALEDVEQDLTSQKPLNMIGK